jgi:hypothetical protein
VTFRPFPGDVASPSCIGTSRRSPSRFDPRVGRVIFVQPYGGDVLGRGVGVEPLIADLHDGSVADSAAFLHANSIGAAGWCRSAERSGRARPVPGCPGRDAAPVECASRLLSQKFGDGRVGRSSAQVVLAEGPLGRRWLDQWRPVVSPRLRRPPGTRQERSGSGPSKQGWPQSIGSDPTNTTVTSLTGAGSALVGTSSASRRFGTLVRTNRPGGITLPSGRRWEAQPPPLFRS